jgi:hypothetical protein
VTGPETPSLDHAGSNYGNDRLGHTVVPFHVVLLNTISSDKERCMKAMYALQALDLSL